MSKKIRFDGPAHELEVEGQLIQRGAHGVVSDDMAAYLLEHAHIDVKVTGEAASDRQDKGRGKTATAPETKE